MYREISGLILYSDLGENAILRNLSDIFRDFEEKADTKASLTRRIFTEVKNLLDLATKYGFDHDLWQNYLTFILLTNENSFSLTAERRGAGEGSVNHFAKHDFAIFKRLFHFDFSKIEKTGSGTT